MAITGKERSKKHAFEDRPPCQERFKQDDESVSSNAKPLNYPSGSEDFVLGATEKQMFRDWTAHAFPSMTDGRKRDGVEGSVSHLERKGKD